MIALINKYHSYSKQFGCKNVCGFGGEVKEWNDFCTFNCFKFISNLISSATFRYRILRALSALLKRSLGSLLNLEVLKFLSFCVVHCRASCNIWETRVWPFKVNFIRLNNVTWVHSDWKTLFSVMQLGCRCRRWCRAQLFLTWKILKIRLLRTNRKSLKRLQSKNQPTWLENRPINYHKSGNCREYYSS